MGKLRINEIEWDKIEGAFEGAPDEARHELRKLRREILTYPIYYLTEEFFHRIQEFGNRYSGELDFLPMAPDDARKTPVVFQLNYPGTGDVRATSTIIVATMSQIVMLPIPSGGLSIWNDDLRTLMVPEAFQHPGVGQADLDRYGHTIARMARITTLLLAMPEQVRTEVVEGRRVVRKGRTIRQPEYRTVALYPGTERVVYERVTTEARRIEKRSSPAEHSVKSHWISRGLDPDCLHEFEDITTEEVLKREHCTVCDGKRTLRRAFIRGDRNKPPLLTVHMVH